MVFLYKMNVQVKRPHFLFSPFSNPLPIPALDLPHRVSEWASALNE